MNIEISISSSEQLNADRISRENGHHAGGGCSGCAPQLLQFVSTLSTHPICICSLLPNFLAKQGHARALASRRSKGWIDGGRRRGRGRGDRENAAGKSRRAKRGSEMTHSWTPAASRREERHRVFHPLALLQLSGVLNSLSQFSWADTLTGRWSCWATGQDSCSK